MTALLATALQTGGARNIARGDSIPAPVKGWNARDPLDGMDPGFAVELDNWFPQTGFCELRPGSETHATGIGSGAVETLLEYNSAGTRKLLAFGNSAAYDASAAGAVGSALSSGHSNNRWHGSMFGTNLMFCNGADGVKAYDGSTISNSGPSSGPTNSTLIEVHVFKNRLFFIQDNSASFWYGGLLAITGTFTEFDLSKVHPQGGKLITFGTMTNDGGSGIDDLAVFVMESGSIIIYSGTNPGDSTAWSLVGIFSVAPPIGRRCLIKIGADLVLITADGYIPLLGFLPTARARKNLAISDNISGAVNTAVQSFGGNFGWQPVLYPQRNMLIFNVPLVVSQQSQQHVMNTLTGAWCRFKGMNAASFGCYNDNLYFGVNGGKVIKFDVGLSDDGSNIEADGQTAFQYFGGRGVLKRFTMYRPVLSSDSDVSVSMGLGVDFDTDISVLQASSVSIAGSEWDIGDWDTADWAGGDRIRKDWQSAIGIGYSASVRIRTETNAQTAKWFSTDVMFETGGFF